MHFYTSVNRLGSNIYCRGYVDGKRYSEKVPFKPTLYVTNHNSHEPSGWTSIHGDPVDELNFDGMKEAAKFIESNSGMAGFTIHGMTNYVNQFVASEFGNDEIEFSRAMINVANLDIEVASDQGFPKPEEAKHPIISIALYNNHMDSYIVWGLDDYDKSKSEVEDPDRIEYRQFDSEALLLKDFIAWWSHPVNTPDVITGWNVKLFDMTYIVNRISNTIGFEQARKLSPVKSLRQRDIMIMNKPVTSFDIIGIQQLDYLDLFKKFGYTYGAQESYRLDHIAHVVLGEKKLSYEEYGNLYTLYKENHQKFIDYNIKDVGLVQRLDDKLGFIELAMSIAYKAGSNYVDTFGTTGVWDAFIYRVLNKQKVAVPITSPAEKSDLGGGHVKPPVVGRHDWVVSFDLNSLYPHLIMQYNMSPDTIVDDANYLASPDAVLDGLVNTTDYSMAATGQYFRRDKRGVLPGIIEGLYSERKDIKKSMLDWKQKKEDLPDDATVEEKYKIDKAIATLDNQQQAIKILMNSLYGAMGNAYFRYFDIRIANAITASGRLSIRWAEKAVNAYMNKIIGTENKDYVIAIDTDSVYITVKDLIAKIGVEDTPENTNKIVRMLDRICEEKFEPKIAEAYQRLADVMNAFDNKMVMKREAIADRGIWTAKKRYILSVHNNEGVQYPEPKLKVMGIEAIKSSTPEVCREKFKEVFKLLITGTEQEVQHWIEDWKQEFRTLPLEDISAPRSVSNITKWQNARTLYNKGVPYHVRGAIMYNWFVNVHDSVLGNRYQLVQDGEKIKMLALKVPNPLKNENVISYPGAFPREVSGLADYVDYNEQFDKVFMKSLNIILDAIGWSAEETADLMSFFG